MSVGGSYGESHSGYGPANPHQILLLDRAYEAVLPRLVQAISQQATPVAQGQYNAASAVSPQYSALGLQQLQQYGLPYAQQGQQIQQSNALAGARTNAEQIAGPGGLAALLGDRLTNMLDPQVGASNRQAANLVNSINLNGLSGSERSEVERSLGQSQAATGNLGLDNSTNAVSNAMNFGNALNQKRTMLGNALNAASGTTQASGSMFNPVNTALGQPQSQTQGNFGTQNFAPVQQGAGQAGTTLGQGLFSNISGLSTGQSSAMNVSAQGGCCFILMEGLNGELPWWVRDLRNIYFKIHPDVAIGYTRMAMWLVPLMKRYTAVKLAVNLLMVRPIVGYGGYLRHVEGYKWCKTLRPVKRFWFSVWKHLGR